MEQAIAHFASCLHLNDIFEAEEQKWEVCICNFFLLFLWENLESFGAQS